MTNFSGENLNAACGDPQGGGMDSRCNGVAEVSPKYLAEAASNAIPVGYKQTEVGVIPEDWDISSLSSLSAKITDGTHDTPRPVREGRPFLTAIHVKDGHIDFDGCYFVSETVHQEIYRRCNPEFGDILMVNIGAGTATTAVVNVTYEFSLKNVALIKPNKFNNGTYVNYALSFAREKTLETVVGGGAQPFLSLNQIANLKIAAPHLKEQTAIANALSDVDALISELEKLIVKKQAIKTATMQQLLTGRTRLPQFALREDGTPKGTKPSELGEMPEDWECRLIPEIAVKGPASIKIGPFGSALKKEYLLKTGYKVYGQENVYEKDMSVGNRYISYAHYVQLKSCSIQGGDFLISMMGTVGKCFVVPPEVEQGIMDSHLLRLRLDASKVDSNLMVQFFQTRIILDQITQLSVGGIMEGLSSKIIKSISIPLPVRIEEQTTIATILSDMDAEIQALEQRLGKTRQIKQGMMQELLTGKTRLIKGEPHG
ncbi:restriction endonuclease subunit S [Shewanella algae]|uniref:Restriction endonuclease subunit S n=2 Tax=Unclassified Bacteria TaxID=49928 RepID=A0AAU6VTB0_UNCXX